MSAGHADPSRSDDINESPGGEMGRPNNHVVAVLGTRDAAERAVRALEAGGFLESETHVTAGESAADALRANTGHSGLVDWAIRLAERLGVQDDDMQVKSRYEQALRDGRVLVAVAAPTEERKVLAAQILREHGGHTINFIGRYTREQLVPPPAD